MPNQDAIHCSVEKENKFPLVLTVSDGHGNPQNYRSQQGSQLATQVTSNILSRFLSETSPEKDVAQILKKIKSSLIPKVVETWKKTVLDHYNQNPLSEREMEVLIKKKDFTSESIQPEFAYGSTLLAAGLSESLIILLQLGDGDILTVDRFGNVAQPIPPDKALFADETTSLCLPNAEQYMRYALLETQKNEIKLLLISTDGYSKSFIKESDFFEVGPDLLKTFEAEGIPEVQNNLVNWLNETSKLGSGDDITLGIVYHEQ